MRHFSTLLFYLCLGLTFCVNAQVAVTTDGSTPDASSMLHVKSTTRGVLMSRMNSSQRIAIASPADGLIVYDTDTRSFWYAKAGTGWTEMTPFALPYTATANASPSLFTINNTNSLSGSAAMFNITSSSNSGSALFVTTTGTGNAFRADVSSPTAATAIFGQATGSSLGAAGVFVNNNAGNTNVTVGVFTNASNVNAHALTVSNTGGGNAAKFSTTNIFNLSPAVNIEKSGAAPALRVANIGGSGNNIGINLVNGYIRVDQAASNKTVFIHTAAVINISGNRTVLSYPGMISSDILIVNHSFVSNFIGGIGVWWDGSAWTIFRQDGLPMSPNEDFNVMVIKQ